MVPDSRIRSTGGRAKKILKPIASLDLSYNSYTSIYDTCEIHKQYVNVTNLIW